MCSNQHEQAHKHLQNIHFLTQFLCVQHHERAWKLLRALNVHPAEVCVTELVFWEGLDQQYSCLLDFLLFVNWYPTCSEVLERLEGMPFLEEVTKDLENYSVALCRETGAYEDAISILHAKATSLDRRANADLDVHLGVLYLYTHQLDMAERHLLAAFEYFTQPETPLEEDDMGNLHHNLGALYRKQGLSTQAHHHYSKAIEYRIQELGPEDYKSLNSMQSLALVEKGMGNLDASIEMYRSIVQQFQQTFGLLHTKTLTVMNNLSVALRDQDNLQEAKIIQQEVVRSATALLGLEHNFVWTAQMNLATIYKREGCIVEAIDLYKDVLRLQRENLGSDNLDSLTTEYKLATTMTFLDESPDAQIESLLKHVYQSRKEQLGVEHSSTFVAGNTLSDFWEMHEEWPKRAVLLEERLLAEKIRSGEIHTQTMSKHYQLAKNYLEMRDGENSVKHLDIVIRQRVALLGEMHSDLAMPCWNMARAYRMLGSPELAAEYRKRCYDIELLDTTIFDPDVLYTLTAWLNDLQMAGQLEQARPIVFKIMNDSNNHELNQEQIDYLKQLQEFFKT